MELFKQAEINVVDQVIGKLPPNAVVATADSFQHPVSFMGRGIAIGYAGHLWSHGIDAHEVRDAVDRIFKGEADWQILVRRLGITHIYWGHREKEKYKGGIMPWMDYDNLSPTSEVGIYDLQSIFQ
jgi:hypothetical protein